MNDCLRYQEMISALIDGELSGEEHSALLAHIQVCHECSVLYSAFSQVSSLVEEDVDELPEGLHENIMAAVRRENIIKNNSRRGSRRIKSMIAAAACFAVVLFAVGGAISELSRRAAVKPETAEATVEMTAMTDSIPTMDVHAAGDANAAVYARANMTTPTPEPKAANDAYLSGAAAAPESTADPYLAPAPEKTPQPAEEPLAAAAPGYEIIEEPAAETSTAYEKLPELPRQGGTSMAAASAQKEPVKVTADATGGLSWETLSAFLFPTITGETEKVKLPEGPCDTLYTVKLLSEDGSAHEILIHRYAEKLYVSVPQSFTDSGIYLAECSVADFETLIVPFVQADA